MKHDKSQKSQQIYRCEKCKYESFRKYDYDKHILTAKHLGETKVKHEKSQKSQQIYRCEICDYLTYRKNDYDKHLSTPKHLCETNQTILAQKSHKNSQNISVHDNLDENHLCLYCNKPFTSRTTLWRHKNKCILSNSNTIKKNIENDNENENDNDIILTIIKQNTELKEFLVEQHKQNFELQNKVIELCKISNVTNNNTIVNSNNKTFNLQVFLNETCKDAMNISDFVESVKLQVSDLENVGKVGYIEGISNIIIM